MNKIIFQVILIVVSVGLFFTVIDPMYRSTEPENPGIKMIQMEIDDYDKAIDNSDEFVREKNKLLEAKNSLNQDDRNRLERLLPDSIDNIRLVIGINDIARPYGLVLKGLRFSSDSKKASASSEEREIDIGGNETIGSVTLGFSVSARYDVFKEFLKSLESSLRLADVTSLSVRNTTNGEIYDYDITIKTYWLR